jgi:hypothetical protein
LGIFLSQSIAIKILHHNWGFRTQNFRVGPVFFRSLDRKISFSGTPVSMEKIDANAPAAKLPKKAKDRTFKH